MSQPRDMRELSMVEAMQCYFDNLEECEKHVWVTKTVAINQGMCNCCRKSMRVTKCRYCGQDKGMLERMRHELAMHKAAENAPFPHDARIGASL